MIGAALIALAAALLIGPGLIRYLKKLHFGQTIYELGPSHQQKQGTPVMGGLMMAAGIDVTNSVIISLSCISNVGLPLNELGPDLTWSSLPLWIKWVCTLLMLLGRLEIFNVLILFTPPFWDEN